MIVHPIKGCTIVIWLYIITNKLNLMKHFVHVFLLLSMCFCFQAQAQGLKAFKLKNGMSVFIWEDAGKSDVFGEIAVRTGAVNDPEQYTGLAHYLEHVMFKGTQKIGALSSYLAMISS